MTRKPLTKETAAAARGEVARYELRDKKVSGLRLVVYPSGVRTWAVRYRNTDGQPRRYAIGTYSDALGLDEARRIAADKKLAVVKGEDPSRAKAAARVAARIGGTTVQAVWDDYASFHLPQVRPSTSAAARTLFNNDVLPKWGKRDMATIRRRDVMTLLDGMIDEPSKATKAKARLNHFFGWAVEREIIEASPVANIKRQSKAKSRDRVLTDDELRRVWIASKKLDTFGAMVRVLILTMARRNEVADMAFAELTDETWTIPEERTKNKIALELPRTAAFDEVLAGVVQSKDCPFVFEGRHYNKPIKGFSDLKDKLDEVIGEDMAPWTLHDLRRTGSTMMQRLGIRKEVIDAAQNHKMPGISATYLRHGYKVEKLVAFEALAREVERIVTKSESNVVAFTR